MKENLNFGEKLKSIRISKNMSQDEFANLLNTSKQVVSRYETNQRIPKITTVLDFANKLNLNINYFLENSDSCIAVDQEKTLGNFFMDMNEKIKMLRKKQRLTLEDVGNAVGVGKSTVRKWESGDIANMRRDKISKLADALHCSPAYLMGWEDDSNTSPLHQPQVYSLDEVGIIDKYRDCSLDGKNYISNQVNIAVKLYPAGESISHIEGLKSSQDNSNISFDGPPSVTESEIQEALSIARNLSKVAK